MENDVTLFWKYKNAILDQIRKELNPSEEDLGHIKERLNKANLDELERTYDTFERFGVKTIMELI